MKSFKKEKRVRARVNFLTISLIIFALIITFNGCSCLEKKIKVPSQYNFPQYQITFKPPQNWYEVTQAELEEVKKDRTLPAVNLVIKKDNLPNLVIIGVIEDVPTEGMTDEVIEESLEKIKQGKGPGLSNFKVIKAEKTEICGAKGIDLIYQGKHSEYGEIKGRELYLFKNDKGYYLRFWATLKEAPAVEHDFEEVIKSLKI